MTPLRFRAWHTTLRLMSKPFDMFDHAILFPDLTGVALKNVLIVPSEDPTSDLVIMQSTGLKDKNGVEIYEGDIIGGLIVTYAGDLNECLGMNAGWYLQSGDFERWTELECSFDHIVLGNIYENPDLIASA